MTTNPESFGQKEKIHPNISGLLDGIQTYNNASLDLEMQKDLNPNRKEGILAEINEKNWRQKNLEELKDAYVTVLDATGLALEAITIPFDMTADPDDEQQVQSKEISLNISDPEKFLSYLHYMSDQELSQKEKISLERIAYILRDQFVLQYDVTDPNDDRFLILIGSLEKIIELYKKIGLEKSVKKLEELLLIARAGYLKEFLLVEKNGYLVPNNRPESPARWHDFMSMDDYDRTWAEAIEIYHETTVNPKAKELSEQLKKHLSQAVDIAKSTIIKNQKRYRAGAYTEYLDRLDKVKKALV